MIVAGLEVGDLQPPRESCPPFTGYQPDWTLEPMCSSHARIVNETRLTAQLTSKVVSSRP